MRSALADPAKRTFEAAVAPAPAPGGIAARALAARAVEGMPWLGTFHAIGVKILRRHAELVGLKNDFTILDVDDQIRLIKQLLEAEHIDEKRWPARVFAGLIDHWKNRGLTPDQVPA